MEPATKMAKTTNPRLGPGHRVYISGKLYWCANCGAYAEQRFKSLKEPCQGSDVQGPRAGQLARLLKGFHPLRAKEKLGPARRIG